MSEILPARLSTTASSSVKSSRMSGTSANPGATGDAVAPHERLCECERITIVSLDDRPRVLDCNRGPLCTNANSRRQPDERVAAEAFAADDGLEQERVASVGKLDVQRQRRIEVREGLEDERDAVIALRREGAEFGFGHGASTGASTVATVAGASVPDNDARTNGQRRERRQPVAHRHPVGRTGSLRSKRSKLIGVPPRLRLWPLRCPRGDQFAPWGG